MESGGISFNEKFSQGVAFSSADAPRVGQNHRGVIAQEILRVKEVIACLKS